MNSLVTNSITTRRSLYCVRNSKTMLSHANGIVKPDSQWRSCASAGKLCVLQSITSFGPFCPSLTSLLIIDCVIDVVKISCCNTIFHDYYHCNLKHAIALSAMNATNQYVLARRANTVCTNRHVDATPEYCKPFTCCGQLAFVTMYYFIVDRNFIVTKLLLNPINY